MRGYDHVTILSPSFHGFRKERLAQNTTKNALQIMSLAAYASETNKASNTGAYVNMVSKIMASCTRNSIRFAQLKSNNVPSNSLKGERRKRIRAINQEMNHNGDNSYNCRRLTFVSHFDFKPNRVNGKTTRKESLFFKFKVPLKIKWGCGESNQAAYHNKLKTHPWTITFSCFFLQRNSSPLFAITYFNSFSDIHLNVDVKNDVEKEAILLLFFLSKSSGGNANCCQI